MKSPRRELMPRKATVACLLAGLTVMCSCCFMAGPIGLAITGTVAIVVVISVGRTLVQLRALDQGWQQDQEDQPDQEVQQDEEGEVVPPAHNPGVRRRPKEGQLFAWPTQPIAVLVIMLARLLVPAGSRERYSEEWLAELEEYERQHIALVSSALRILYTAPAVGLTLRSAKYTTLAGRLKRDALAELLVGLAVVIAGRKRAWRKSEIVASMMHDACSESAPPQARLYHAADLVRGAVTIRAHDIHAAFTGPSTKITWVAWPAVPTLLMVLGLMSCYFAAGHGFAAIIDHVQDLGTAGGETSISELIIRRIWRRRD